MAQQLHKQFSSEEVKNVLERYENKQWRLEECLVFLKLKRRRFFDLLKRYRESPKGFSIEFKREQAPRGIDAQSEKKILLELKKEARLIEDPRNPVRYFNYSYLKEILEEKHGVKVSLPTIIVRAKKLGITKLGRSARPMIGKY